MADESVEHPTPERSGQLPGDGRTNEPGRSSNRRRIIIASLLAPPAVMTLGARSAQAQGTTTCLNSLTANPHTSHKCPT
ncbi:MAG TPA: hypothetical protein VJX94_02790 [Stellaceae bacterium]|nr:hypothetical protein [Stellaceae bacterium]